MNLRALSQSTARPRRPLATAILSLLALGALGGGAVRAAVVSWIGASDSFSAAGNWTGTNAPPISGDSLVFGAAGAGGVLLNNNLTSGSFDLAGIAFASGASAFTIGDGTATANAGNAFALTGNVTNNSTSLQTINNPFSMTAVRTFTTAAGGGNLVVGGNLSGVGGGILATGGGTLILTGANTYSGGTTIASGTLQLGNGGASGSVVGNVINNGTLVFKRSDDYTFGGVISGSGGLVQGGYIVRLSAAQTYSGPTQINSGAYLVLPAGIDNGLAPSTVVTISAGGFLDVGHGAQSFAGLKGGGTLYSAGSSTGYVAIQAAAGQSFDFSGTLGGSSPNLQFEKFGSGTQILSGTNTYTGGTTIWSGTLQLGNGAATGSIVGNVINKGTFVFKRSDDYSFTNAISGNGSLVLDGYILRFIAAQTYAGPTQINSGAVLVLPTGVDQGLAASSVVTVATGGNLDLSSRAQTFGGLAGGGTVYSFNSTASTLTLDVASGQTQAFSGALGGSFPNFALTKAGPGTQVLSGANTYNGATTVNGGTLRSTNNGALSTTLSIAVNNAGSTLAVNFGGASDYTPAQVVTLLGTTTFGATSTAFAFDTTNATGPVTYGNALAIPAGLTKLGAGTLTLTALNTYPGATTVNGGTLQSASNGVLGTTPSIAVNNAGSTLAVNFGGASDYTLAQVVTLLAKTTFGASTTAFAFDTTNATGPVTYGNALVIAGGVMKLGLGTLTLTAANTYPGATFISAGTLQLGSGGTTGSLAPTGAIIDNGTLVFNRTGLVTQGTDFGRISGTGQVIKEGSNTLILTGTNTYAGGTIVNGGTLQLGDGIVSATLPGGSNATTGVGGTAGTDGQNPPSVNGGPGGTGGPGSTTVILGNAAALNLLADGAIVGASGGLGGFGGNGGLGVNVANDGGNGGTGGNGGSGGNAITSIDAATISVSAGGSITGGQGGSGDKGGSGGTGGIDGYGGIGGTGGAGGWGGNAATLNQTATLNILGSAVFAGGQGGSGAEGGTGGFGGIGGLSTPGATGGAGGGGGSGGNGITVNDAAVLSVLTNTSIGGGAAGAGGRGGRGGDGGPSAGVGGAGGPGGAGGVGGSAGTAITLNNASAFIIPAMATVVGRSGNVGGKGGDGGNGGSGNLGFFGAGGVGGAGGAGGSGGTAVIVNNPGSLTVLANAAITSGNGSGGGNGGSGGHGGTFSEVFGNSGKGGNGGNGAVGGLFSLGGSVTNSGTITAGTGGVGGSGGSTGTQNSNSNSGNGGDGGNGAVGLLFGSGGSVINSGTIAAGAGGTGGTGGTEYRFVGNGGNGGNGATGVAFNAGGSLSNSGTISGGAGGGGGAGGRIIGGVNQYGLPGAPGVNGLGVIFAGAAGTLGNLGGGTIGGVSMANFANSVTLETGSRINGDLNVGGSTSSTLTLSGTGSQPFSGAVTGSAIFAGALTKNGTGTWTLDRSFNYAGPTMIQAGTLKVTQPLGNTAVAVSTGAALDGEGSIGTGGSLLFNGGTTLRVDGSTPGTLSVGGNLTLNGTINVVVDATPASVGNGQTIRLLTYSGTLMGSAANLATTQVRNPVFSTATASQVNLTFDTRAVTWSGGTAAWDVNTTANWNAGAEKYFQGDAVTFDNTGTNKAVVVNSLVAPATVTFSNGAGNDYTVSGSGSIASGVTLGGTGSVTLGVPITGPGAVSKSGPGTLTLSAINTYPGATAVTGGTLEAGISGTITASSGFNVSGGGTLLISNPTNNPLAAAPLTLDTGTLKFGNALNSTAQTLGTLTLDHIAAIDFGTGTVGNTFTFTAITLAPTFTGLSVLNWTGGNADHLVVSLGTLTGADLAKISFYDDANQFLGTGSQVAFNRGTQLVPVPEPSAAALLAATFAAFGAFHRRRRHARVQHAVPNSD